MAAGIVRIGVLIASLAMGIAVGCESNPPDTGRKDPPAPKMTTEPTVVQKGPAKGEEASEPKDRAPIAAAQARSDADFVLIGAISKDLEIRRLVKELGRAGNSKTILEKLKPKGKAAVDALVMALRVDNVNIRIQAALILPRLTKPTDEVTAGLTRALTKDPDQEVRASVARAMKDYEAKALVAPLIATLEGDEYETARANAAWALGAQGDKAAVPALVKGLEDEKTWVRLRSVSALKRLKARKALPALVERLKDDNKAVRERALQALRKISGKKWGDDYDKWKRAYKK